jgi:hypothetical protein
MVKASGLGFLRLRPLFDKLPQRLGGDEDASPHSEMGKTAALDKIV